MRQVFLPTASVLYRDRAALDLALGALGGRFGAPVEASEPIRFAYTDYYEDEVGKNPYKLFLVFDKCSGTADLADWKRWAVAEEARICAALGTGESRPANVDPGVLTMGSLALASTKEAAHRVWVSDGIWVQIELLWRGGTFVALDWTYRDYAEPSTIAFFNSARKKLALMRRRADPRGRDRRPPAGRSSVDLQG